MTRSRRRLAATAALVLALAGGCGDDSGDGAGPDDPAQFADESLDAAQDVPSTDATTDPAPTTSLNPTDIPGEPINQFALEVGDCFDRLEDLRDGRPVVITTRIACDEPHHYEVFHRLDYPAPHPAVYPGEAALRDFALQSCYREFTAWVGTEYELSALEIGVLVPPLDNFEDDRARYRGIHCWVERVDGEPMDATSRDSGW